MIIKKQDEYIFQVTLTKEELETIMHELMDSNINEGPVIDRGVNSIDMVDKMLVALKDK